MTCILPTLKPVWEFFSHESNYEEIPDQIQPVQTWFWYYLDSRSLRNYTYYSFVVKISYNFKEKTIYSFSTPTAGIHLGLIHNLQIAIFIHLNHLNWNVATETLLICYAKWHWIFETGLWVNAVVRVIYVFHIISQKKINCLFVNTSFVIKLHNKLSYIILWEMINKKG